MLNAERLKKLIQFIQHGEWRKLRLLPHERITKNKERHRKVQKAAKTLTLTHACRGPVSWGGGVVSR